jgi:hypothetical protein
MTLFTVDTVRLLGFALTRVRDALRTCQPDVA